MVASGHQVCPHSLHVLAPSRLHPRSQVLSHPDFPVPLVTKFEARVVVLDVPIPVLRGQQVRSAGGVFWGSSFPLCSVPQHRTSALGLRMAHNEAGFYITIIVTMSPRSLKFLAFRRGRRPQVTLHAHTARESGHISGLVSLLNPKSGEVMRAKPRCLLKGQAAVVEVTPARCVELRLRALGGVEQ